MPKSASVVSFASSKGGPGKTTALIVAGDALAAIGKKVVMLDADPNCHLLGWSTLISKPTANLRVVGHVTEEDILDRIREEGREADLLLVDLEGTANNALTYATSKSDLVVIPAPGERYGSERGVSCNRVIGSSVQGYRSGNPSSSAAFEDARPFNKGRETRARAARTARS